MELDATEGPKVKESAAAATREEDVSSPLPWGLGMASARFASAGKGRGRGAASSTCVSKRGTRTGKVGLEEDVNVKKGEGGRERRGNDRGKDVTLCL
jgi:hypothetical protein